MVSEMVSQTKVLGDVSRNLVKMTKAVEDMDRNLNNTLNKLIRVMEHSNQLEVNRLRDIQIQNRLAFEKE